MFEGELVPCDLGLCASWLLPCCSGSISIVVHKCLGQRHPWSSMPQTWSLHRCMLVVVMNRNALER